MVRKPASSRISAGQPKKGRPRRIRSEIDEIEDMDDLPATTGRPPRPLVDANLSIIQGVVARRAGQTTTEQVNALLVRNFPSPSAQTARAMDAIKTWLSDPSRSKMPTEDDFPIKPRRTSTKKR